MGIFLDTVEDNQERGWDKEIDHYIVIQPDIKSPMEVCPECRGRFFTDQDLQDHIFEEHRHKDFLVRVGDKIQATKSDFVRIEKSKLKNIEEIFRSLQEELQIGQSINTISFLDYLSRMIQNNSADPVAHQYCQGLLVYLEVSYFETFYPSSSQDIISRLENVYGYLQPFYNSNSLAKQIRCAIALKFNWFKALAKAPKDSFFYLAHIFFTRPYEDIELIQLPIESIPRNSFGLYVTENLEYLLELIAFFFSDRIDRDRYNQSYKYIETLETDNFNFRKKLYLINARVHRRLGNREEAERSYKKLKRDIDFSHEAKRFLTYD